jgi:hypothetical protein
MLQPTRLLILAVTLGILLATGLALYFLFSGQRRLARRLGYPSLGAYLRAAPRTDEEKKYAADLALKGLVICSFCIFFGPFLLLGLFPFFYGARKVVYALMGLGLFDDADQPGA